MALLSWRWPIDAHCILLISPLLGNRSLFNFIHLIFSLEFLWNPGADFSNVSHVTIRGKYNLKLPWMSSGLKSYTRLEIIALDLLYSFGKVTGNHQKHQSHFTITIFSLSRTDYTLP